MSGEFHISLPASSANLGPAFDAAALAWDRTLEVRAGVAEADRVSASGRDAEICDRVRDHLILATYRDVLRQAAKSAPPLALELHNAIPVGKGCGSSAAARLAGVALASRFGGLRWTAQQIFEEAARREGHADNAAACWWGGLVLVQSGREGELLWLAVDDARRWPLLLVIPDEPLATETARQVLPDALSRGDAVANVQSAAMLVAAWQQGREDLLTHAMAADRLHQPYRAPLCPLLPALLPLAGTRGIVGCALSGAGPSVLILARDAAAARAAIREALAGRGLQAEILETSVLAEGPGRRWDVSER